MLELPKTALDILNEVAKKMGENFVIHTDCQRVSFFQLAETFKRNDKPPEGKLLRHYNCIFVFFS